MRREIEPASFTIIEFCGRNRISPSQYFELKKQGKGPREMAVGTRGKRISQQAETDWQREREAAAARPEGQARARPDDRRHAASAA
jgi:hypothetical protein